MKDAKTVYLGLGANLGNREKNIEIALRELNKIAKVIKVATIIETDPVGTHHPEKYLNTALEIQTELNPTELIIRLEEIEHKMGRVRRERNEPRQVDLDILLYSNLTINTPPLQIPHPRMHKRRFVLEPLAEIAPDTIHPTTNKTISQLLKEL